MSSKLSQITPTVQLPTGLNKLKPTANCTNKEVDQLLLETEALTSPQFKSWYALTFRRLGRETVLKLASQAKADGKDPARLFSYLLKRETNKAVHNLLT